MRLKNELARFRLEKTFLFSEALKLAKANLVCQNHKNVILVSKKSTETNGEANGLITFITHQGTSLEID